MDTTYESKLNLSDDDEIQLIQALAQPQEERKPEHFKDIEARVAKNLVEWIWCFLKAIFIISITTIVLAVLAIFAVVGIICLLLAIAVIAIAFAVILVPIGGFFLGLFLSDPEEFKKTIKEAKSKK